MTHTGPTKLSRDPGVRTPTDVTGLPPTILTPGPIQAAPRSRLGLQETVTTAHDDVAGRARETRIHADLAGSRQSIGVAGGTMWWERPRPPRRRRKTMRRLIVTVAATFAMATATVLPAHAGIGGVRYLYVGGTVATNGTVTWKIVNSWHSDAMTTSKELGPVTALFLRTTYITDPTPLASGECDTVTVSGSWRDGYRLGGYLSATVCAP